MKTFFVMSSTDRLLATLQLFSAAKPVWTVEEAAGHLGVSVSTTYRYFKSLRGAGLLDSAPGGFALGPAFVHFDRLIQDTDPLLQAARPVMEGVIRHAPDESALLLCRLYSDRIMCVHQVCGAAHSESESYERGRPVLMFRGATAKVILAHLPNRKLRQIYERNVMEIRLAGLGEDWPGFRRQLTGIAKAGYYVARQELEPGRTGIAVPLFGANGDVLGSLSLGLPDTEEGVIRRLITLTIAAAREIEGRVYGTKASERGFSFDQANDDQR